MSMLNIEAEKGSVVSVGSDGRIYGIDHGNGNDVTAIVYVAYDVRKGEIATIYTNTNIINVEPNLKFQVNNKIKKDINNIKINIKNNAQIARDRLDAII